VARETTFRNVKSGVCCRIAVCYGRSFGDVRSLSVPPCFDLVGVVSAAVGQAVILKYASWDRALQHLRHRCLCMPTFHGILTFTRLRSRYFVDNPLHRC
jgi:hypothetical protein